MKRYNVTLESPDGKQSRFVSLRARSKNEARIRAEASELAVVDYDLHEDPFLAAGIGITGENGPEIDHKANRKLADDIVKECEVNDDGKARGPNSHYRAKFHQHQQTEPYTVRAVEYVPVSAQQLDKLIRELMALQQDPDTWQKLLDRMKGNDTPIAAVTAWQFGVPKKNQYDGTAVVDWDTDTMKVALLTSGYTPNQDTHDFFDDQSANEASGTGYTAGGATLGSKTATYDTGTDQMRLAAANTTWTTSTVSADYASIYKSTGVGSTSPLMGLVLFGATVSTTAGTFQITWDSTGIINDDVT